MTKVILNNVGSLIDATTAASTLNSNNAAIQGGFDNTLSRDGTSPNQMLASLDMNSHHILNLPIPTTADEPLRYQDLSNFVGGGTVTNIPAGGSIHDVLAKASNTDFDVDWSPFSSGVVSGFNIAVTGTSPVTVSTIANPSFTSVTTPTIVFNGSTINTKTGTGALVLGTSPNITTPTGIVKGDVGLGNVDNTSDVTKWAATKTLTNTTYDTAGTGNSFLINGLATSSNTGTGAVVRATSPTLTTPVLGTPTSGTLTNATGLPITTGVSGLASGVATFLATPTSANLASAVTNETGSGALVFATSPALVTPTGIVKGDVGLGNVDNTSDTTKNAAAVTLTNKTIDTAGGNVLKIGGTTLAAVTGTGAVVLANGASLAAPTLVTPTLGIPATGTLTNCTGLPLTTGVTGILPIANGGSNSSAGPVVTIKKQIFTASGTYTPSTGMLYAILECVGGGGGGGSTAGTAAQIFAGGGGGSGSYSRTVVTSATVGASKTVTIGAGGTGGASGSNNGASGGDTSVGVLCVGKGGSGGLYGSSVQLGMGGNGGVAGTGDLATIGSPGGAGTYVTIAGNLFLPTNFGATSYFGGGAQPPTPVSAGTVAGINASANTGGGGSGASSNAASNAAGGNGGSGVIFITEFCNQ